MLLQLQKVRGACLVYSLGMCIGEDAEKLIRLSGVRPDEVINPELPEPHCFRGYHYAELTKLATRYGYMLGIYCNPMAFRYGGTKVVQAPFDLTSEMDKFSGIVCVGPHALAWDKVRREYYNPSGVITNRVDADISVFMPCAKIR